MGISDSYVSREVSKHPGIYSDVTREVSKHPGMYSDVSSEVEQTSRDI